MPLDNTNAYILNTNQFSTYQIKQFNAKSGSLKRMKEDHHMVFSSGIELISWNHLNRGDWHYRSFDNSEISIIRKLVLPENSGMCKKFYVTYPQGKHPLFSEYYEEIYTLRYQLDFLNTDLEEMEKFDILNSSKLGNAFYDMQNTIPSKMSSILRSGTIAGYGDIISGVKAIQHPARATISGRRVQCTINGKAPTIKRNTNLKPLWGIESLDFILEDKESNCYSLLSPTEARAKLILVAGEWFDEKWEALQRLEDLEALCTSPSTRETFGLSSNLQHGDDYYPSWSTVAEQIEDYGVVWASNKYSEKMMDPGLDVSCFDNEFFVEIAESISEALASYKEYSDRYEKLYPKYNDLKSTITSRLEELNSESYYLELIESVQNAIALAKEKAAIAVAKAKEEELALQKEKAKMKEDQHQIWLTGFASLKQKVRNTMRCGCLSKKKTPKDNYPTKADAFEVAAKQMKKNAGLELEVYACDMGQEDSYGRHHGYGGWHLTSL
jgi:hypothetical protein